MGILPHSPSNPESGQSILNREKGEATFSFIPQAIAHAVLCVWDTILLVSLPNLLLTPTLIYPLVL